ncbi:cobalamin B12-binding domain-containing protein [Anaeromicrobium sediminis]|uniref:Methyltransferase n=1 Tax=Anaeromicrobium sediminis TaxID=1478221 RepID=A0A267MM48_9FIRM|nr:corrinoid protein [Anaeromicrobium sediminis]PAB60482.1 methyltransferase [Anaeromicrobium sediminis]
MSELYEQISESILDGDVRQVTELVQEGIDEGLSAKELLNDALLEGMNEVGVLFKDGELFVPEVLMAARAMDAGVQLLKPLLQEGDVVKKGKIVFATVKGDLHDIGKKLCIMMLEGAGYEVVDIGMDVPPEKIVEGIKEHNADIVAMSAMLTTTMAAMKESVEAIKENALYDKVRIMVGGAPVSEQYAVSIGANYSADATSAVELANELMAV